MRSMSPSVRLCARLRLEALEDRLLPAVAYPLEPIVPTIDAADRAVLAEVLQRGLQAGNRANVFAKAGDSITVAPDFLTPLGRADYNPSNPGVVGPFGFLADTVHFFRAVPIRIQNSFSRTSVAARGGLTAAEVLQRLLGELALTRPAFVLIMVGTNDVGRNTPIEAFRQQLTQ